MEQMGHIERKSMLYRTKVEYGDWAMNHVQGCSHGCNYPCYAYLMAKRFGRVKTYEDWKRPLLVDNTLALLKKELPRYRSEIKQVQLCFTTDPFMEAYPEVSELSLKAIQLINSFDIPCVILTKGVLPNELAFLPKAKLNTYGITLVATDERYRKAMEPGAATYSRRLNALEYLHDRGLKTWVSMEPYPTPNICKQNLGDLLEKVSFADRIVFGKTHYDKRTTAFAEHDDFYRAAAEEVRRFCDDHGIDCHIKKGTAD
jgi:DNA repair photolyase